MTEVEICERDLARIHVLAKPHPTAWHDGTPCWEWQASKRHGYGVITIKGRTFNAHRLLYELTVGRVPMTLELDHLCRRRWCVNPGHLEPVTHRENVIRGDSLAAMRLRQSHCKRGHEFDQRNTYVNARNNRVCRACHAEAERRSKARKRA